MFTNNYFLYKYYTEYAYCNTRITLDGYTTTTSMKDINGNAVTFYYTGSSSNSSSSATRNRVAMINFKAWNKYADWKDYTFLSIDAGTSDAQDSREYYTLAAYNSNISTSLNQMSYTKDANSFKITRTLTIILTNNSEESITIKEIGVLKNIMKDNTNSSRVLFYREVLNTPITIAAGQSETYVMNIVEEMP